jgi:hypothetical protein
MSESAEPGNNGFVAPAVVSLAPAPAHTTTAPTRPWTTSSEKLGKPEDAGLQSTDPDKQGFVGGLQSDLAYHARLITGLTGRKCSRIHWTCGTHRRSNRLRLPAGSSRLMKCSPGGESQADVGDRWTAMGSALAEQSRRFGTRNQREQFC